jgi:hypothetical protein
VPLISVFPLFAAGTPDLSSSGFGQQFTGISVDSLPFAWQREQLEWFAADIAPELRRSYPDSLWT